MLNLKNLQGSEKSNFAAAKLILDERGNLWVSSKVGKEMQIRDGGLICFIVSNVKALCSLAKVTIWA